MSFILDKDRGKIEIFQDVVQSEEGSVPFSQAETRVDSKEWKEIQEFFQRKALFRRKRSLFLRSRIKQRLPALGTKRVEDIQWKFFLAEDAFEVFHFLEL